MADSYVPRKISEIVKTDSKVSVIGSIVSAQEASFKIKGDGGNTEIAFNPEDEKFDTTKLVKGSLVRVYCTMIGSQLKADVIQALDGFDAKLFKKVEELYNKAGI